MELREDVSFDLSGFSLRGLTPLPGHSCLVATNKSGRLLALDLASGKKLHSTSECTPGLFLGRGRGRGGELKGGEGGKERGLRACLAVSCFLC